VSHTRRSLFAAAAALAVPLLLVSVRVAADDTAKEAPPAFDAQPFLEEKSPAPTRAEWASAPLVTLDPSGPPRSCEARRLREWVRLRCKDGSFGAIRILAGPRDGMQTTLADPQVDFGEIATTAELVIPVRRGDARVIEVMEIEFGYKGSMNVSPWLVVSEQWPPEDERPTFVLR
jgi:hypothetical protein